MNDYRMLVLDLDGTTLDEHRSLTDRDRDAALALKEAGVHVTIATGRLYPGTGWVARALGVEGSVAVLNGNELVDVASGEPVSAHYLDADLRRRVRARLREHGLQPFLFGARHIHYGHEAAGSREYLQIWSPEVSAHDDIWAHPAWTEDGDLLALCAQGDDAAVEAVHDALAPELPEHVHQALFHTYEGRRFLHVAGGRWNKGTALRQLAQERGLRPEQVVAVGDWWNDEPMFREAGRAYAMHHATDDLKALADEVLDASREGGAVAEVAERVWGIR